MGVSLMLAARCLVHHLSRRYFCTFARKLWFSSKTAVGQHGMDKHIRWINGVLEQLKLTEVVYIGQDWVGQ